MLVTKSSLDYLARSEAGGKGYNLYLMSKLDLPVPDWVVLGKSVYDYYIRQTSIEKDFNALFSAYDANEVSTKALSHKISELIESTPLPVDLDELIATAYEKIGLNNQISIRSSAADEDGGEHSFAGLLSSYLYVKGIEDAKHFLKCCWASAYSERSIAYRSENNIPLTSVSVAVVFQKMIDPDVSGVLFTCDPTTNRPDHYVISANYGVGEGIVSGKLECDTYWLDVSSNKIINQDIARKTHSMQATVSGNCQPLPVDTKKQLLPSLNFASLSSLTELGSHLTAHYKTPLDIEWAIVDDQAFLLQCRPITTLQYNPYGVLNLWDNSNIVESYGGITLPLTFTFALENYKNVYVQFCEILGLSRSVVKDMEYYLGSMLGSINGHVYYNLYNWYKLVGILPGFKHNHYFMETMMGVGQPLSDEVLERIEPHPSWNTFSGKVRKLKTGLSFLFYHFNIQRYVDSFLEDFDTDYQIYKGKDYASMSSDELFMQYIEINRKFLSKWKAPIINDFLCMIHFGIFKKLTETWLSHADTNIQNSLLAGDGNLESAEPTRVLIECAGEVFKNEALRKIIVETPDFVLLDTLKQSRFQDFYNKISDYIERFGFRCISEMKMEEKDLHDDPSFLFTCLKNYIRAGTIDIDRYHQRERYLRETSEKVVDKSIHGWKKLIYNWALKNARKSVRNRENTRFARTRIYGIMRSLFRELGIRLSQLGAIDKSSDIYYLSLQELYGIHQGTLTGQNLKGLVDVRKQDYQHFRSREPGIRFQTHGPVYWRNNYSQEPSLPEVHENSDCDLVGIPCCPGIVEGRVRIIHSAADDLSLNGEILVAKRTDPGWVPIFPSISGLLVERGSLLSHSAIVAREMGIPAVVGVSGLLKTVKDGMRVRLDGQQGTIKILQTESHAKKSCQTVEDVA